MPQHSLNKQSYSIRLYRFSFILIAGLKKKVVCSNLVCEVTEDLAAAVRHPISPSLDNRQTIDSILISVLLTPVVGDSVL